LNTLLHWLNEYGLAFAFANVLAEQLGLPVPAYPVLIVTGALSADGRWSPFALLAVTVLACLLADLCWYAAGRRWGSRVLRTVCRISISPDSCVRQTESLFTRWGPRSLLVAKFIPGFATIAAALSGRQRVKLPTFLFFDTLGAIAYAGGGILLGRVFHAVVDELIEVLENLGRIGLVLLLVALAAFIAAKWWQRHRLIAELRMARITVPELDRLIQSGRAPTILDVRSAGSRERDGTIPGARAWSMQVEAERPAALDSDGEVVVFCACPNEASAARVAQQLRRAGFTRVRPLHGGLDAWVAAGLPVERTPEPAAPAGPDPRQAAGWRLGDPPPP
jgi:membrane protein DedA with SNARE-associated domain/rhodanese-related sulfurtransferase